MGGLATAINLLVPIPFGRIMIGLAVAILSLQIWGSYILIRNIFRWLASTLLAPTRTGLPAAHSDRNATTPVTDLVH